MTRKESSAHTTDAFPWLHDRLLNPSLCDLGQVESFFVSPPSLFPPSSLLFSPLLSAGHYTMTLLSLVLALSLLLSTSNAKMQKCNRRANNALHREMTKSNSTTSSTSTTASASYESGTKSSAWFPVDKIRGVNLGSWFLIEPVSFPFGEVASQRPLSNRTSLCLQWMVPDTWNKMGCDGYTSERSCNEVLGIENLQSKYEHHWNTFYSQDDFYEMKKRGLNTVRIPLPCKSSSYLCPLSCAQTD